MAEVYRIHGLYDRLTGSRSKSPYGERHLGDVLPVEHYRIYTVAIKLCGTLPVAYARPDDDQHYSLPSCCFFRRSLGFDYL